MATISTTGIGSGLDINSLVSQLVAAETGAKNQALDLREAEFQAELSAFGTLKGVAAPLLGFVKTLADTTTYQSLASTSSDTSILTVSNDTTAVAGNYQIDVIDIARAHKLSSAGFANDSTVVGTGTLTVTVGSDSFVLTIDSTNDTVAGIRDAINNALDNTGVTASTINVDDGVGGTETRLVLTADSTGTSNQITTTAVNGGTGDLQQLEYDPLGSGITNLTELVLSTDLDAQITIDGLTVTSNSNTISSAVTGVTFTLVKESPGTIVDVTVAEDTAAITTAITSFVDSFNTLNQSIRGLTSFNADTEAAALLLGDPLVRTLESQLRRIIGDQVTGLISSQSLASIGITTLNSGDLTIDTATLNDAILNDKDNLVQLFTATDGIATRLEPIINSYVKFDGIFDSKTDSIDTSIEDIVEQREALVRTAEALEERLLAQFIAMDLLVAQLNATGTFLTQQLDLLPKPGSFGRRDT